MRDTLLAGDAACRDLFDRKAIEAAIRRHEEGKSMAIRKFGRWSFWSIGTSGFFDNRPPRWRPTCKALQRQPITVNGGVRMSIFEAIGLAWVIFTSALASVGIIYLAYIGLKSRWAKKEANEGEMPAEVKEMFKIAR